MVNQKYKKLAILFMGQLIKAEKEIMELKQKLENGKVKFIKIAIEEGDFIPYLELDKILTDEKNGEEMEEDITQIMYDDKGIKIEEKVEKFFEKYI